MVERWFPDDLPAPAVSRETLPFWQGAAKHRLMIQVCTACGEARHPPAPLCARCRSFETQWRESSGRGSVYSFTVVHQPFLRALASVVPYVVAVIELADPPGVKLISNVVGLPAERVRVGLAVEVAWEDVRPGLALPRFRPAGEAEEGAR